METPQVSTDMVGHHPCLRSKQNYRLHERFVENTRGPGIRPIPDQDPGYLIPHPPIPPQILYDLQPVIFQHGQDPPYTFKQ